MLRAAVLWDLDGVLIDSSEAHYEAWRATARARGIDLEREAFRRTFGMANPDAIRAIFGEVPPDEARRIAHEKEQAFRALVRGRVQALPGAERLVRALRAAGHRQAIASSAPRDNLGVLLGELGLADCFDAVVSGDDIARGKPDPEIFLRAASALGAPADGCVVIEDADVGVEAGRRARMRVYAVTTSRRPDELASADRIVESLEELDVSDFVLG